MTDKDEIKFAIRYLKQGLKSKRTPPLYEELMDELGFVRNKELGKLEGKLADLTSEYYELENLKDNEIAELKTRVENQKSFLERIRAKFNLGEIDRKEVEGYLEGDQLTKAKEIIKRLLKVTYGEGWNYSLQVKVEAEKFLKENE